MNSVLELRAINSVSYIYIKYSVFYKFSVR